MRGMSEREVIGGEAFVVWTHESPRGHTARAHYADNPGGGEVFVERPTADAALAVLRAALAEVVAAQGRPQVIPRITFVSNRRA